MRAIITFHSIDTEDRVLSYPPVLFEMLLGALEACKLPVCSLDTLLDGKTEHGVALTFDDGMQSVFRYALPAIRDHKVPAHLFLTTGTVGGDNHWPTQPGDAPCYRMLNWDEVEALHEAGILVESHTHTHPDLRRLSRTQVQEECEMADTIIEQHLGRRPRYFAYPYGYISETAKSVSIQRYAGSVTTKLHYLDNNDENGLLPRLDSYYLKSPWLIQNLDSVLAQLYLGVRGFMRSVRGSQ